MKNYTKIICILDRSGSMSSIIDDAIGGFNSFLKSQQDLEGEATMRVHMFDSEGWNGGTKIETPIKDTDIQNVIPLTRKTYSPRGGTPLYDAIGFITYDELDWLGNTPIEERPEKTICIILTDGQENASSTWNNDNVKKLISECREELDWEFIYLGANQDACFVAESMGMSKGNSFTYEATGEGVNDAYSTLNVAVSSYRKSKKGDKTDNLIDTDE
jgi:hypothetical protein